MDLYRLLRRFGLQGDDPSPTVNIDVTIEKSLYEQLHKCALEKGLSENVALEAALRKGMEEYWFHVTKNEAKRYLVIEKIFDESKRDRETFLAIVNQNAFFQDLLNQSERKEGLQGA